AMLGDDLQRHSRGRFVLGLGAQVRAHVEHRFGAAFDHPAARMKELVLAIRAVWDCWQRGGPLHVEGTFYRLGLMTPAFSPGPNPFGHPRVFVAAVGPRMAEVAGEVADGLLVHGFSTAGYLRDVTLPAIRRGEEVAGRPPHSVSVCRPVFVVTGRDEAEIEAAAAPVRERLGFYGSTPSYRPVLDHEGWGSLGAELRRLVKAGRWSDLGGPIDGPVLDALAIVGPVDEIADRIAARFGGLVDRVSFNVPFLEDPATWAGVVARLQAVGPLGAG
ncbi:MAG: TIGR03617 family F420-dependent LLM class oxidoreductase, partial [Acidimicrobiales bacterium]